MAGSEYQAPQRRFAVVEFIRWKFKMKWCCCTYKRKGRVSCAHLVDKGNVGLNGTQAIVDVE